MIKIFPYIKKVLSLILLLMLNLHAWSADKNDIAADYRKAAKRYRFKIEINAQLPPDIGGTPLPAKQLEPELIRFFAALDEFDSKFVRKSALNKVVICKNLTYRGKAIGGHARNGCIYLNCNFRKFTVYHELFHIFDDKQSDPAWRNLNQKKFRYGTHNYRKNNKFAGDFVSPYAQSKEREDRAETFAAMMADGRAFAAKAAGNRVLYAKMQYIIKMTCRRSLLSEDFWRQKLGNAAEEKNSSRRK